MSIPTEEVSKVETEVQNLKDELLICKEAVTVEESYKKLTEYCEGDKDGIDRQIDSFNIVSFCLLETYEMTK